MGDVVKVFFRFRWGAPVSVGGGTGPGIQINGPAEALTYLLGWSHKKTVLYEAGVLTCREALTGQAHFAFPANCSWQRACRRACCTVFVRPSVGGR